MSYIITKSERYIYEKYITQRWKESSADFLSFEAFFPPMVRNLVWAEIKPETFLDNFLSSENLFKFSGYV